MKLISAKYAGKCAVCREAYGIGDAIYWNPRGTRGKKALHSRCYSQRESQPESQPRETSEAVSGNSSENTSRGFPMRTFSVDWADLKAAMKSALAGKPPRMKVARHSERFSEYLGGRDRGWTGFTREDVTRWLERGYQLDGLNFLNPPIPIRDKRRYVYEEENEEFNFDRFISGEDNYFSGYTKREEIPGLAVEAEICLSSATHHDVLSDYFGFICRAVYALESAGVDLEVSLRMTVTGLYQKSPEIHSTSIRVKRENEATDFNSWSAMLSPASLRAFGFCAMLLHADSENLTASGSLGSCNVPYLHDWKVSWNAERSVLEIHAKQHGAKSFPAEDMEAQLREALDALHKPA